MTAGDHRFWTLLSDLLGADTVTGTAARPPDVMLDIVGRPVQVRLDERGLLHVSSLIHFNDGDESLLLRDAIAEFNAVHLFAGGYALLAEPESASLYIDQSLSLNRFDAKSFRAFLVAFAHRATNCGRWYGEELARRGAAIA